MTNLKQFLKKSKTCPTKQFLLYGQFKCSGVFKYLKIYFNVGLFLLLFLSLLLALGYFFSPKENENIKAEKAVSNFYFFESNAEEPIQYKGRILIPYDDFPCGDAFRLSIRFGPKDKKYDKNYIFKNSLYVCKTKMQ